MIIINQDRDKSIKVHKKLNINNIKIQVYNRNIVGYNIIAKGHLLGTFDTLIETFDELNRINNYKHKYYFISGFENYKESRG